MHMMPDPKRFNVDAELYKRSHPPVRSMVSLNSKRIHINSPLFGNGHSLRPGDDASSTPLAQAGPAGLAVPKASTFVLKGSANASPGPDYPGSCIVNNPTSWSIFNGLLCRLVR